MKKILFSFLVLLFVAVNANAVMIGGHDLEEFTGSTFGAPTYNPGSDLGYYLWTDDESRRDWHVRWSGDTDVVGGSGYNFSGDIMLSANNMTDVQTVLWESSTDNILIDNPTDKKFFAFANVHEDGFDFSIVGNESPSYLGFNLDIVNKSLDTSATDLSTADISQYIFLGSNSLNPSTASFAVAAPVPEPATLLLLGSGLVGLAFMKRRKK